MRKLKLYITVSLDGKIARKDGSVDFLPDSGGEDYGFPEFYASVDTIAMGYKTYEQSLNLEYWYYGDKVTYVFTHDCNKFHTSEVNIIAEDPREFVKQLKESHGKDIWLMGGGNMISLLHDASLIDEYMIATVPVIIGEGVSLFSQVHKELNMKITGHQVYPNGMAITRWIPEPVEVGV